MLKRVSQTSNDVGSGGARTASVLMELRPRPQRLPERAITGRPKVMVDGMNLTLSNGTGVATYARNLILALADLGMDPQVLFGERLHRSGAEALRQVDFFDARIPDSPGFLGNLKRSMTVAGRAAVGAGAYPIPASGMVETREFENRLPEVTNAWNADELFQLAMALFRTARRFTSVNNPGGFGIAHWTFPVPLKLKRALNVYTVHDLVPLRLPFTSLERKREHYRMIERICQRADRIVTVSEQSRRDILDIFGVDERKVVNTYQCADIPETLLSTSEADVAASLAGLYGLEYGNYLLFVGAVEPKKNVGRLIEAYLASGIKPPLVIVGKKAWLYEKELRLLEMSHLEVQESKNGTTRTRRRVYHLDHVPFRQLVNLIRGATALTFPSLYEGFGLPILEAMVCGTPVLTSDLGAMKEVAGDAALMVDPYSVSSITDGIRRISSDEGLRTDLVARGHEQKLRFTRAAYIERLEEAYRDIGLPVAAAHR